MIQEKCSNWFVYIVQCADDSLYTGVTNRLEKRIEQHNLGKGAKYTRGRGPVVVVWSCSGLTRSEALQEEARIKKLSRDEKFKQIKNS